MKHVHRHDKNNRNTNPQPQHRRHSEMMRVHLNRVRNTGHPLQNHRGALETTTEWAKDKRGEPDTKQENVRCITNNVLETH